MKKSQIKELMGKSLKELREDAERARREIVQAKLDIRSEKVKNVRLPLTKRKDLARILTIIRMKEQK